MTTSPTDPTVPRRDERRFDRWLSALFDRVTSQLEAAGDPSTVAVHCSLLAECAQLGSGKAVP
jgi:hypothetical protein